MSLDEQVSRTLNRLAKWRTVFTGWQLGTRRADDPEAQALRDHRDATTIMRVEVNALTTLLLEKGVFTHEEFQRALIAEAEHLEKRYEEKFPGFRATDHGMSVEPEVARETTKGWRQ